MWSYRVQNPLAYIGGAIVLLFGSMVSFAIGYGVAESSYATTSFFLGAPAFLLFGLWLLWQAHEINVTDEGTITFVSVLGSTPITAQCIHELDGRLTTSYDGKSDWSLRVRYTVGSRARWIDVPEFDSVRMFAARIQELNPSVKITGVWPMGTP